MADEDKNIQVDKLTLGQILKSFTLVQVWGVITALVIAFSGSNYFTYSKSKEWTQSFYEDKFRNEKLALKTKTEQCETSLQVELAYAEFMELYIKYFSAKTTNHIERDTYEKHKTNFMAWLVKHKDKIFYNYVKINGIPTLVSFVTYGPQGSKFWITEDIAFEVISKE